MTPTTTIAAVEAQERARVVGEVADALREILVAPGDALRVARRALVVLTPLVDRLDEEAFTGHRLMRRLAAEGEEACR